MIKKRIMCILLSVGLVLFFFGTNICVPLLRMCNNLYPGLFYEKSAVVSSEYKERGPGIKFGVHYTHYVDVIYKMNGEEYMSSLFWCRGDTVGQNIELVISKHRLFVFRKNPNFSYEDFYRLIVFVSGIVVLIKLLYEPPDKISKKQKNEERQKSEDNLLNRYKKSNVNRENECKQIKIFLKKSNAMKLYDDLSIIFSSLDLEELISNGFLFRKQGDKIDFIEKTKQNWENGHYINYIILQVIDGGYIMYSINEDCIYLYNRKTYKYEFVSGSLSKYLLALEDNSFIQQMVM